ncbi:hypothetical protein CRG98_005897 [Punica granatum]|uniref:Uncharacterized protein n=1 Tax=Punica granatum TaxID=22663 RepID=A0A2I0L0L6_PUNGR|nr:hypothetical protein CRG98_005897 [Punica granatum]
MGGHRFRFHELACPRLRASIHLLQVTEWQQAERRGGSARWVFGSTGSIGFVGGVSGHWGRKPWDSAAADYPPATPPAPFFVFNRSVRESCPVVLLLARLPVVLLLARLVYAALAYCADCRPCCFAGPSPMNLPADFFCFHCCDGPFEFCPDFPCYSQVEGYISAKKKKSRDSRAAANKYSSNVPCDHSGHKGACRNQNPFPHSFA